MDGGEDGRAAGSARLGGRASPPRLQAARRREQRAAVACVQGFPWPDSSVTRGSCRAVTALASDHQDRKGTAQPAREDYRRAGRPTAPAAAGRLSQRRRTSATTQATAAGSTSPMPAQKSRTARSTLRSSR